jgi:hypothetical protein
MRFLGRRSGRGGSFMNEEQRKIVVYALCGLSALLVFVFWRFGTQYDYSRSLLVWKLGERSAPSYFLPPGLYGLRLRMGEAGVLCGLILPVVLGSAAAYIWKANKTS